MERRRTLRARVHGTAILRGDRAAVSGPIENVSLGGLLLRTNDLLGRTDALDVELQLPAARVRTTGRVVRVRRFEDGPRTAIRFDRLSPHAEDAIEDEIVRTLGAARTRPVLVLDEIEERRDDIATALRDHAMTPLTPRTPLDLVDTMSREQQVEVCVVGTRFHNLRGAELTHFLHDTYPWLKILPIQSSAHDLADDVWATWDEVTA